MIRRTTNWCGIMMIFFVISACQSSYQAQNNISPKPESIPLTEGIQLLASTLIDSAQKSQQIGQAHKIAVADFVGPDNRLNGLGEYVADKLSEQLFNSGVFPNFVERRQLKNVLQIQSEEMKGYFDSNTVIKFGNMTGMDAMVIGTIQDFGGKLNITAKIIQAESGQLLAMADVQVKKDQTTEALQAKNKTATLIVSVDPPVTGQVVAGSFRGQLENGVAVLDQIPYGSYDIIVQPQGYEQVRKRIVIGSPSENVSISLEPKSLEAIFQIVPPGAMLTVDGKAVDLNTQGYAVVKNLENKIYTYVVKAPGHEYRTGQFNPVSQTPLVINLPTPDPFLDLKNKFFQKYKRVQNQQEFDITLFSDKSTYRVGDSISFFFEADKDCYVHIVLINAAGDSTVLFPNRFHQDNRVRAGVRYRIPDNNYGFEFKIEPPVGEERIYAIASTHPMTVFDNDFEKKAFTALVRGQTRDIAIVQKVGKNLEKVQMDAAAECIIYTH